MTERKDYCFDESHLRPDVTKLPHGIELTNLLEDFLRMSNSGRHGERLQPLHGGAVYYDLETRSFKRDKS